MRGAVVALVVACACGRGGGPDSTAGSGSSAPTPGPIAVDGPPIANADVTLGSDRFRVQYVVGLAFEGATPIVATSERLASLDIKTGRLTTIASLDLDARALVKFSGGVAMAGSDQAHRGRLWIQLRAAPARDLSIPIKLPSCVDANPRGDRLLVSGRSGLVSVDIASGSAQRIAEGDFDCVRFVDDAHWIAARFVNRRSLGDAMDHDNDELVLGTGDQVTRTIGEADVFAIGGGGVLIAATRKGSITIRDVVADRLVASFASRDHVKALAVMGDAVVAGNWDGTITAYGPTGTVLWGTPASSQPIRSLAVANNGSILFASDDHVVGVLAPDHRVTTDPGPGHRGPIVGLAWSKDRLVSAGQDGTVRVWDLPAGRQLAQWTPAGRSIETIAANDAGRVAAVVSVATGMALDIRGLDGHTAETIAVNGRAIGTDRDGHFIVGDDSGSTRVVPNRAPEHIAQPGVMNGHVFMLGGGVAAVGTNWALQVRTGAAGTGATRIPTGCSSVQHVASDMTTHVAVLDGAGKLRVWTRDSTFVRGIAIPADVHVVGDGAITPDGSVVFPTIDGVLIWSPSALRLARVGPATTVVIGPAIAVGFSDGRIAVWHSLDTIAGEPVRTIAVGAPANAECEGEIENMVDMLTGDGKSL